MINISKDFVVTDIFRIIYVGKDEYPNYKIEFKSKKLYYQELIFNLSGYSTVYFNDEVLINTPDSIRYLPTGDCNKYIVDKTEKGDCIDIFFASSVPLSSKALMLKPKNQNLATLFKKAFSIWVQKDEGYYLECISLLYKILAEIQKTSYIRSEQFDKIEPAISYIQNNFLSKELITSKKLAEICKISYSYVKRLFALKFKVSPKRYIEQLKMNYACDLLMLDEYHVSKIADACGYSDVYSFSHQFKKEYGLSPTDFRKKYKSSK